MERRESTVASDTRSLPPGTSRGSLVLYAWAFLVFLGLNVGLVRVVRENVPSGEGTRTESRVDGRRPSVSPPLDPDEVARQSAARIEANIARIPKNAAAWGPSGLRYAKPYEEAKLRAEGWHELEIQAKLRYREAILEWYRKYPDGRGPD